jgi:tail lysozyme
MPVETLTFDKPQAVSAVDWTPLMQLANQRQTLNQLGPPGSVSGLRSSDIGPLTSNDRVGQGFETVTGTPYTGDRQAVAKTVADELRAQGFSDHAVAGILYNIGQESNFNPNLRHPDQPRFSGEAHYAHGLFQEGGDEWSTWASHMQGRGATNWQDPLEQARFVAGRLKGEIGNAQYANVLAALQAATSKEEAAKIFARGYLKPAERYLTGRVASISRGIPDISFYTGAD